MEKKGPYPSVILQWQSPFIFDRYSAKKLRSKRKLITFYYCDRAGVIASSLDKIVLYAHQHEEFVDCTALQGTLEAITGICVGPLPNDTQPEASARW